MLELWPGRYSEQFNPATTYTDEPGLLELEGSSSMEF